MASSSAPTATWATVGPSRDALLAAIDRPSMRAVLAGHTHYTAIYDGDGASDGIDLDAGELGWERWPLRKDDHG